jgi:hypothetical protein
MFNKAAATLSGAFFNFDAHFYIKSGTFPILKSFIELYMISGIF